MHPPVVGIEGKARIDHPRDVHAHRKPVQLLDVNQDGMVSFDELYGVMSTFAMGLPEEAVVSLTKQLLRGESALRTGTPAAERARTMLVFAARASASRAICVVAARASDRPPCLRVSPLRCVEQPICST